MTPDQPTRIVLIEDNPADVVLLRHALDAHNFRYELDVLQDGEQALRFVREYRHNPCEATPGVLVLDFHLPRYDGLDVLRALRSEPSLAHVRVVALTGAISPSQEAAILALGVRLYRNKPTDLEEMLKLGEEIMSVCSE